MDIQFERSVLKGKLKVPTSKSIAHRNIICASLSNGMSSIQNISFSKDILATVNICKILGAVIEIKENALKIQGIKTVNSNLGKKELYCEESGSTLRFSIPVFTLFKGEFKFTGAGMLMKRPLTVYEEIFKKQKIPFEKTPDYFSFKSEKPLQSEHYSLRGDISSQFITGLLLTLPLLEKDSSISFTSPLESSSYVDLTMEVAEKFKINIKKEDNGTYFIKGRQNYVPANIDIEGDYSQAGFYFVANYLGSDVEITNLNPSSAQGDKIIVDFLKKLKSKDDILNFDASDCPDIIPVFSIAATLTLKKTVINNVKRLKIKECNRLKATVDMISKLGGEVSFTKNTLEITGKRELKGGCVIDSNNDHRMAMSVAIASLVCKNPVTLTNAECISKSYPDFFKDYNFLGGKANVINLGK